LEYNRGVSRFEGACPPTPGPGRGLDAAIASAQPKVERILANARIPVEDAEDLLHDAFVQLFANQDVIDDPEAWLVATVKWATQGYWRLRRRRVIEQLDLAITEQLAVEGGPCAERMGLSCDLERQLRELPNRCRRILAMRYRLGMEPCELASELGYRAESVRKVTKRCLHSLAVRLTRGGYAAEGAPHG
jgi:RNA polymerase sigma factor (sigma-70 family)